MTTTPPPSDTVGLDGYHYRGARALVILHDREMRRFVDTWRRADAAGVALPPTPNTHYSSRAHLLRHVLRSARGYMVWMTSHLGLPDPGIDEPPEVEVVAERADAYLEHLLERWRTPLMEVPEERFEVPYTSYWGEPFTIDSMLEHAVMHPIRHRFQLEELLQNA